MAIKNKKEITQFLGNGGGETTPITKPEPTPVGNNVKAIDKTGGKTIQQVSDTGAVTNVAPDLTQMLGKTSTSTPSTSGNSGGSNPKIKNDKQLIEFKPDSTTQTHNLDVTKTPKPGTQIPTVSPENNPSPSSKIKAGLENIGNNIKDFFGKFGKDSKEGNPEINNKDNPSENAYYDIINANKEKPEYKKSDDTSSGAASAEGTQYSWDEKGASKAQNQYQQDLLKAKQDALANRQTIEQNALQYQQQSDMMQYANNQNAEKVGWTGGYVLDQNRQMDYLKASIQAQMYGAMELQKYGYDSALAAARLSYDLNQQEFAHQYYQDAVNVAISEAQITGTYFSAETRDMMSQYNVAEQNLGDLQGKSLDEIDEGIRNGTISLTPEQSQALEVKRNIENWYSANNVSKAGIQTLAAWEAEQSMAMQWADSQWEKFQAAMSSADNKIAEDVNAFIMLDENGNPIYDGTSVKTGNFRTMSAEEIINYANTTGEQGKEQVYGYVDGLFEEDITNYISSAETTTNADGSTTVKINPEELEKLIKDNPKAKELGQALGGYEYTSKAGDSTVTIKVDENGEINVSIGDSESTKASSPTNSNLNSQMEQATTKGTGVSVSFDDVTNNEDLQQFNNITVQDNAIDGNKIDDDFDVDIGSKNYDLDVDWKQGGNQAEKAGVDEKTWNNAQAYLKDNYGNPEKDSFVMYDGHLWFYSTKAGKWGYVQQNTGGKKLYNDLQTAASGQTPTRWEKGQQMTVTDGDNGGATQTLYGDNLTFDVQSSAIRGSGIDDDFDIDVVVDGQRKKNYDIDVDWEYGSGLSRFFASNNFGKDHEINGKKGEEAWNEAQNYLQTTYPNQTSDTFVIYGDCLWYYNASQKKWGYVQNGAGGKKLFEDLKAAQKGDKPDRWK